jgi:hypothetical protein
MPTGHAVFRENWVRDEMVYELTVYAAEGGFCSSFTCPFCGTTDLLVCLIPQATEAIRQALSAADSHHSRNHSTKSFGKSCG